MKISKIQLKQLLREELELFNESEWDVSKRTAFPRAVSQILSALREVKDIVEGKHLSEEEPVSPHVVEEIKKIFDHRGLAILKELGGVGDEITTKDAYGVSEPGSDDDPWRSETGW